MGRASKPRRDPARPISHGVSLDRDAHLKRLRFRAWHRGVREADLLVGGFFDRHHQSWSGADLAWFEALLEEQDVDIIAWAFGTAAAPARFHGPMLQMLQKLDYIEGPGRP